MAIKPCKECGSNVSTKAKHCPSCGAPVPKWGLLKGFLFLLCAIALLELFATKVQNPKSPQEHKITASSQNNINEQFEPMSPEELASSRFENLIFDDRAMVDRAFSESPKMLNVLKSAIESEGHTCDSISFAHFKRFERGISIHCNNHSYKYSIEKNNADLVVSIDN